MSFSLRLIRQLNDSGFINFLALILSPLISFVILFFTLKQDKNHFKIQVENQEKEHRENIKLMEEHHVQELNRQTEINRISIMPYFELEKSILITKEKKDDLFRLFLNNKGNGMAIQLRAKSFSEPSEYAFVLFRTAIAKYYYATPFDSEKSMVNINSHCFFEMRQILNEDIDEECNADRVVFTILYQDINFNQYEQTFRFLFNKNKEHGLIEINRVESFPPKLVK
jgi:hypothetical protein